MARGQSMQIALPGAMFNASNGLAISAPNAEFRRIEPDGSIAWRLKVDSHGLLVNCLVYTAWGDVWSKSKRFISEVLDVASSAREVSIRSALFQVVDVFNWSGLASDYSPDALFAVDSEYLPKAVLNKGHLWHSHQGWYVSSNLPSSGKRLLERVHIDCAEKDELPHARIDVYHELSFSASAESRKFIGDEVDGVFDYLHVRNKQVMRNLLTATILRRIGLND